MKSWAETGSISRRMPIGRPIGPWTPTSERSPLVVADPDPDGQAGIEADEPGVAVVVGGAGLAAERPPERQRRAGGPVLNDAPQQVRHHVRRVGPERVVRLRPVLLEHVAVAVGDLRDQIGRHPHAPIGEYRVGARHLDQ